MPEMLDIVDKNDCVVGKSARKDAHKKKLLHRQVQVVIMRKGRLLIQKRSKNKDVYPSYYEAGLSGHVQSGETYEQTAKRELKEELGIKNAKLKKIGSFIHKDRQDYAVFRVYSLEYSGKIVQDHSEVAQIGWGSKIPKNTTPAARKALVLIGLSR